MLAEQRACEWTQAPNATSNGGDASRVGKRCSYYLAEFALPSVLYPDAGRVAPISACVWSLSAIASPPLVLAFSCSALMPYQGGNVSQGSSPPSTNQWLQTPQSYSFCPKMRQKDAVIAVFIQKNAVKVCRLRGNAYFCTRNSGCSSARLEYASGGRVVAGSNPVTPTLNCMAVSCSRS